MKITARRIFILIVSFLISASIISGKDNGKGKGKQPDKNAKSTSAHFEVDVFVESHRDLIRHHYRSYADRGSLPPGLAKRGGDLPPGLEKQLQRNGHLPPGLEKKLYPFPVELERSLPPLKPGLIRGIIGGSAVIVNKETSVILDVFAVL